MAELPTGTVTFLFTDIEGSTRLWEEHPEEMKGALARHDEILRDAIESHDGHVVKTTGDGVHAAFRTALDAVSAAAASQRTLASEAWDPTLRVRMGLHTGEAEQRDGDYYGPSLNRAARLMATGHGGQILVSRATEELIRDTTSLRDLGEHRLRDLARPEHVFQVVIDDIDNDFPALRSLDAFPGNLPLQVSTFIGREHELAEVGKSLEESRIVTLTGVGGVGKTRLATHVAAEVLPRFPNGAWLCELAAASDQDAMVQVVAATLGVQPRAGMSLEGSIREFVGSKELLIVLDNCEHVLTGVARFTEQLLHECPHVRVLATSREGLAVEGEQVRPLRSLAISDDADGSEATQLFVDRARAARPEFALDPANAPAVAEICRRLDGIPLAIELAAARVAAMSPSEIADLLDERFRLLTGGRRTAVERHQTLRAAVDWSYSLLEERERTVFERLGVFAGSFDADAVAVVVIDAGLGRFDVLDAIASLVAKSMITVEDTGAGESRYQMLETLRQYARERLDESGAADAWRRRHAEHYTAFAERTYNERWDDELGAAAAFERELDNLRAAVTWGLDATDDGDAELALRIIAGLGYDAVVHPAMGVWEWAERALDRAEDATLGLRCSVLAIAAYGRCLLKSEYDSARDLARSAMGDGTPRDCAVPLIAPAALAVAIGMAGDPIEGMRVAQAAQAELEQLGAHVGERSSAHTIASMWAVASGDFETARIEADAATELARESGMPTALSLAHYSAGLARVVDDPAGAILEIEESLRLTRMGAGSTVYSNCLNTIARLSAAVDVAKAAAALRDGLVYEVEMSSALGIWGVFEAAVVTFVEAERFETAAVCQGFVEDGELSIVSDIQTWETRLRRGAAERAADALGREQFDAAHRRGAAMSKDDAVALAFAEIEQILADA